MSSDTVDLPPLELLQLLSDGKNHSGQELANVLKVSRTAIWKQLSKPQIKPSPLIPSIVSLTTIAR
ncbi:MAG: HTH domain-containing protein [Proteobacteria bacterium]|nr:MAG: HTH domain-containing protein [Pseudomonadota bacterium]